MCLWLQSRTTEGLLGPCDADAQTSQPPPQHVCQAAPLGRECAPRAHPRAFMPFNSLGVAAPDPGERNVMGTSGREGAQKKRIRAGLVLAPSVRSPRNLEAPNKSGKGKGAQQAREGAWLVQPSGFPGSDQAGATAARRSEYRAAASVQPSSYRASPR